MRGWRAVLAGLGPGLVGLGLASACATARGREPTVGGPSSPAALATAAGTPALGVTAEPPEELVRQRERRQAAGLSPSELVCDPLAEAVMLCLTVQVEGGYRYATAADLEAWALTASQARLVAVTAARGSLGPTRPEQVQVIDMPHSYRLSAEGDGLDHAALVAPDLLATWYGEQVRVAVPGRDVLLAWSAGDEELDRVMAVGVARIHEASEHPVTARVFTWDAEAGAWSVWGQAVR